jgi:serine/threonine protein kinase/formylglycine-generating enzyme required for sulfatase activity
MSDSSAPSKSCPQCGVALPSEATEGLCPRCILSQAMQATQVSDASKPRRSFILTPEALAPFFPQYEILRMLGRGGMGAVYLARQISLNRLVAIKILPSDLGDSDLGFAERFKNEAQAMAQLSHPGIVAVYDFGQTTNGLLFIVMEYIEGTDVQLMLASQGRLHSAHAMAITAHVCDALQYAHSCGIIHRDIKPSNIMVGNNGVVKVADFGLAKMSQGQTTGLTQSGMAMGTPHFMAPEALTLGSAVDQRADIYAVGVMLYQMLTGKLPQGMFEMPSFQVPGLDPRYDRIVAKALREDRSVRYQAAAELRHDLDAILTQPVEKTAPDAETEVKALPPVEARVKKKARVPSLPPQAVIPVPARKKPVGLILAALGVIAALAAGFIYLRDHQTGQPSGVNPDLAKATKEQPFVNTLGMKFVPVPGTGVLFCIHETRKADYAAFAKMVVGLDDSWEKPADRSIAPGEAVNHPVVNVNEADAMAFCAWLGSKDGLVYRLPTDHEWSCAVGIGDREDATMSPKNKAGRIQKVYPWGSVWPPPAGAGNFADSSLRASTLKSTLHTVIDGYTDGFAGTAPVMSFPPNQLGIYDLAGNVWELCSDWYDSTQTMKAKRGGCWDNAPEGDLRSSSRLASSISSRGPLNGIRVVVERRTPHVSPTSSLPVSPSSTTATKDAPFTNTLGMKFVPVPIGGGPTSGQRVLFSIWDTRVQDYLAFARANKVNGEWQAQQKDGVPVGRELDHPVVGVNWEDAQAFCQ